ncbi:hypothetical protein, partial [Bradyrhizobium sp. 149]|uniref:hypothetical protein n=1 Tax=Bradyrhizobium sp. 149 TaxID=2782624 RepID=UPI001FFB1E47
AYVSPIPAHPRGAIVRRHDMRAGLAVDAAASGARLRAGRIALRELKASRGRTALSGSSRHQVDGNVHKVVETGGEMAGRAYGKTVWSWPSLLRSSSCGGGIRVNRRGVGDFREGEGGQNELGSRESTA